MRDLEEYLNVSFYNQKEVDEYESLEGEEFDGEGEVSIAIDEDKFFKNFKTTDKDEIMLMIDIEEIESRDEFFDMEWCMSSYNDPEVNELFEDKKFIVREIGKQSQFARMMCDRCMEEPEED